MLGGVAPQNVVAVASVLVALITVVAPILTDRSSRRRALVEVELLEKLKNICTEEAGLLRQVLNNRMQVWVKGRAGMRRRGLGELLGH